MLRVCPSARAWPPARPALGRLPSQASRSVERAPDGGWTSFRPPRGLEQLSCQLHPAGADAWVALKRGRRADRRSEPRCPDRTEVSTPCRALTACRERLIQEDRHTAIVG